MFCQKCGLNCADDWVACPRCQNPTGNVPINQMSPSRTQYVSITSNKNKTSAIILCLIGFIGLAGLHRLYVGKIVSGIIYLLTFGIMGLGSLVDLIQLLLGQFNDNVGQPLRR